MNKIISIFPILFLMTISGCTLINTSSNSETTIVTESNQWTPSSSTTTWALEFSNTGNIQIAPVMNELFRYLDSENKTYASGSFGELIAKYPKTIVYFYPKDGTPNCTIQALDFSMMLADFRAAWYNVIGVSKDSVDSHKAFADANELKIQLLEDGSGNLLRAFGDEGALQTYGNGDALSDIIRSTFIIDAAGKPLYAFRDIAAKWHARRIYELATGNRYNK